MSDSATSAITELSAEEGWQLLAAARYGRLAVVIAGAPDVFVVNIVAKHPSIYFRTAEGTKLFAAAVGHPVAIETDRVDADGAWSVVAKGAPRLVQQQAELDAVEALGLAPWVPTIKRELVAIDVESVSARRFAFGPEPEDLAAHPTD